MAIILNQKASSLGSILAQHKEEILSEWLREMGGATRRSDLIKASELESQCRRFIDLIAEATAAAGVNVQSGTFDSMRDLLADISRSRASTPATRAVLGW